MKNLLIALFATLFLSFSTADVSAQGPLINASGGYVVIVGTDGKDNVSVSYRHGLVKITITTLTTSTSRSFPINDVDVIYCSLGHGNDLFYNYTAIPDYVFFDSGANFAQCGSGDSFVIGGSQSDWIFGGGGDDHLEGGYGQDLISGGEGNDELYHSIAGSGGRLGPDDGAIDVLLGTFWIDAFSYTAIDHIYLR